MQIPPIFTMTFLLTLFIQTSVVTHTTLAATQNTTIELGKPVHFVAPNGDDVVVPSGLYTIDVSEEWLRLTPGEARDALLLQARRSSHKERVAEPVALSIPSDSDQHHIVVLLPDGETIMATGTYSGIRSRAPPEESASPSNPSLRPLRQNSSLFLTPLQKGKDEKQCIELDSIPKLSF
jgi:hypothetical protein